MGSVDRGEEGREIEGSGGSSDQGGRSEPPLKPEKSCAAVSWEDIEVNEVLGKGRYAEVKKAIWLEKEFAVKLVKEQRGSLEQERRKKYPEARYPIPHLKHDLPAHSAPYTSTTLQLLTEAGGKAGAPVNPLFIGRGNHRCGQRMSLVKCASNDGYIWRCIQCRRTLGAYIKKSVRHGSFFSKSHVPLAKLVTMIYYWAIHPAAPRHEIQWETGVLDPKTVTQWYHFIREICQQWAEDNANPQMLGGPGVVVEIDESKLYKAKYNRGRGLRRRHKWVFGLLERNTHRVVLLPVDRRDARTLIPLIAQWVHPGSTIVSDSWAAYGGIARMQQGYQHWQVNHRYHFVHPNNRHAHTQGIEATWSDLKRQLQHLRGTSDALFESYLFRYMFRRATPRNYDHFGHILYWISHYY